MQIFSTSNEVEEKSYKIYLLRKRVTQFKIESKITLIFLLSIFAYFIKFNQVKKGQNNMLFLLFCVFVMLYSPINQCGLNNPSKFIKFVANCTVLLKFKN